MTTSVHSDATISADAALAHGRRLLRDQPGLALAQARAIIADAPDLAEAHRLAAHALRTLGRDAEAAEASLAAVAVAVHDGELMAAGRALAANEIPEAEARLRQRLKYDPTDVAAIRMLAEVAARIGRLPDAEKLLTRALELAPGYGVARANLATVYYKQNRHADAVATLDAVLAADPGNMAHRSLKAAALGRIGGYDEALALYGELTERFPDHAKIWMSYAHMLKTVGRQEDSIAAYRRALAIEPTLGEVWWSLANLKTVAFDAGDRSAMASAAAARSGDDAAAVDDRLHLAFAQGKAAEDAGDTAAAFDHYAAGNALQLARAGYDPADITAQVDRAVELFTPAFFAARDGAGDPASDPIFILGMPRAGSTLIEQILSSHPMIEGTMELPDIPALALGLGREAGGHGKAWLDALADVPPERLADMGAAYLRRTAVQRKSDKPFYIDKLPNNWLYTGFIRLILPNARIIDARRHPLDCGWSNFRQHYAKGQMFSYSLDGMGRYYRDYVRMMAHIDRVQPGRVYRVIHEALVDDPEAQVRALLDWLGVPFAPACLDFHRNPRAVRTASSEQVRRPINRDGMGAWRPHADRLGPLIAALGPVLDHYPAAPDDL